MACLALCYCNSDAKSKSNRKNKISSSSQNAEMKGTNSQNNSYPASNPKTEQKSAAENIDVEVNQSHKLYSLDNIDFKFNENNILGKTMQEVFSRMSTEQMIDFFVKNHIDINIQDSSGDTLLHYFVWINDIENVKGLLSSNKLPPANLNIGDKGGYTPLHIAAYKNNKDICRFLILKNANFTAKDKDGWTPLHLAALKGNIETLKTLLAAVKVKGVDINVKDNNGWTPLHLAALKENVETLRTLLAAGMSKGVEDNSGMTPLFIATAKGNMDMVRLLAEKEDTKHLNEALNLARRKGHKDISAYLEKILENNSTAQRNPASTNSNQQTRKKTSQKLNQDPKNIPDICPQLLKNIQAANWEEVNALMKKYPRTKTNSKAASEILFFGILSDSNIVNYLLDNNIDVNVEDEDGKTPLYIIADQFVHSENEKKKLLTRAKLLIEHGADVNKMGLKKIKSFNILRKLCLLHRAVDRNNLMLVQLFVENGANVNAKADGEGIYLIDVTPLFVAARNNNFDIVKYLVENGADVNATGESDAGTVLHILGNKKRIGQKDNYIKIVNYLIDNGADVNKKDRRDSTPLQIAARESNLLLVECLIAHGAGDKEGALEAALIAAKQSDFENTDVIKYLEQAIAKKSAAASQRNSAFSTGTKQKQSSTSTTAKNGKRRKISN